MRLNRYISEENAIQKGLEVDEPEVKIKYSDESVTKRLTIIKSAISAAKKLKDDEAKEATLSDLEDKLNKWENVDKETKPAPPPPPETEEAPPEDEEEAPPEEEEAPPEEEEKEEEPEEDEEEEKEEESDKLDKKKGKKKEK